MNTLQREHGGSNTQEWSANPNLQRISKTWPLVTSSTPPTSHCQCSSGSLMLRDPFKKPLRFLKASMAFITFITQRKALPVGCKALCDLASALSSPTTLYCPSPQALASTLHRRHQATPTPGLHCSSLCITLSAFWHAFPLTSPGSLLKSPPQRSSLWTQFKIHPTPITYLA